MLTLVHGLAALSLSTTTPIPQNFDGMTTTATATLPADFKADKQTVVRTVGTYAGAVSATELAGGANLSTSAQNGIYNFGSGTNATGADRAIGFLSSSNGTKSGNLYAQLVNNTGGNLTGLQVSYDVEKYRNGSNPAGFSLQLYYSTDGTAWTSAGATFLTSFSANTDNSGFTTAPGATVSISNQTLNATIPNGSNFYLAWNYSVTSGTTTSNAQGLAIDNISILGLNAGGATNPSGVGTANPNTLTPGESTLLTVTVTPGTTPPSTGLTVTGNLSSIGGSTSQPFFDDGSNGDATAGDNIFSYQAIVAGGTTGGAKTLPVSILDAQSRSASAPISLTVTAPSPPSGTGAATPTSVEPGNSSLLTVTVTPGTIPASTGLAVTADLSSIGGSASQMFFDDGTNGDAVAGNNVFSFNATVIAATTLGTKSLPFTITDAQARSGSGNISLTVFTSNGSHNPAEHLVMGNPSGATADTANPNNYLMMKLQYALSYNNSRGIPNWTSWHLDSTWRGSASRQDDYRADTTLPAGFHQVQGSDYSNSGFDRGHMTPSADRTSSIPDNSATFLMTNMVPQAPGNNQGPWNNQENYLRTFLPGSELYIVSGGAGTGGIGSSGAATTIAGGSVTVPAYTWKVALILPVGDNDVSRVDTYTRIIAVIMPNNDNIRPDQWQKYLATVDQVEALSGYDVYSNVPVAIQDVIEAKLDAGNDTAPVTSGQTKTTAEDQNVPVTLSATDFNVNNVFTYTIVSPPQHGTLSGSGANRTYTPDTDYFGPDSFTYRANDGALDSNISTVSITVTAINDAPVLGIDGKTTQGDTPLSFPASDLTVNDSPGPANESGQTLTVTTVASNTGGTVSLNAGTITFTPSLHFSGTASFTYTVCDNGQTNGGADPKCANGTVNVTVTPSGPAACSTNVAAASYGATASASSQFNSSYATAGAIDGNHTGAGWGTGVGWNDATAGIYPDSLIVNLGVIQQISEIDVYSLQDNYTNPVEPTAAMTFTQYGLTDFQVQTPDGVGGWVDMPDGYVIANNLVKKRIIFQSPIATSQIRILVNSSADGVYSRVVEVEAFSCSAVPAPTPTPTPSPCATNVAAVTYGATASASSEAGPGYAASGVIDGNRAATNWGTGTGWNDGTAGAFPDSVVVNFGVNQSISEVDVYSLQDNYTSPVEPTDSMTFNYYGLTDFQVQIPDGGSGWVDVPGGHVTGNNLVKRRIALDSPIVTDRIRVLVNASADGVYSRITEVEAFSCSATPGPTPTPTPTPCTTNVAASSYGATAAASSTVGPNYPASGAIDGNHTGAGWGTGVGWNDATAGVYPDSLTINLNATQAVSEVDVYSLQDNYNSPIEPTDTTTFNYYGLTDFEVQVPDGGGGWVDVPGGHVTGNNLVKQKVVFASPVMTNQIRILVNASADGVYSRIVEVEAFSCTPLAALPGLASEMSHGKETTTVSLK
jgi:endonuclease G